MKQKLDKNNSLSKKTNTWKKNQGMVSLTFEELKKEVKDKELFMSNKIDGELTGCEFANNETKFSSKDGRLRWDLPVEKEVTAILKKNKIKNAIIFGELAKVTIKGKPVHFNDTMSAIRKPEGDEEEHIDFFPFELYEIDGKKVSETYENYKKSYEQLLDWFTSSKYVYPVDSKIGTEKDLDSFWEKYVEKGKNEGIVVRTDDGKIYKSKPLFTLDLGVIAVEEGRGKNTGRMGALILGFYDGSYFYKVINLGVGFSDSDRKVWWDLANKYKVDRKENLIWIDPFKMNKVIETQYERLNFRPVDTYKFEKGKWSKTDDLFAATISKPNFVRERTDKDISKTDLRLTQIPDFEKMRKQYRSSSIFQISELLIEAFLKR